MKVNVGPDIILFICSILWAVFLLLQPLHYLMPSLIVWSPVEQFPKVLLYCPKCSGGMKSTLLGKYWTDGHSTDRLTRLLHCVQSNVLLLSWVYACSQGHEVYGHNPGIMDTFSKHLGGFVQFRLWYKTGFTQVLLEYLHQSICHGLALQDCERVLSDNYVYSYFRRKRMYYDMNV